MNDDIEQRVRDSLRARATAVTAGSLGLPVEHPAEPRARRWPALVASAAVVLAAVGITVATADRGSPQQVPPARITSTQPSSSTPPTSVTTMPATPPAAGTATSTGKPVDVAPTCGDRPCELVQSVSIAGDVLEVLAADDPDYPGNLANPVVRERGGAVLTGAPDFAMFVTKDSLRCVVVGGRPVCLLSVGYLGDSDASLGLVRDGARWRFTGAVFPTPYGALSVRIQAGPRVVAVESRFFGTGSEPEKEYFSVRVFRWDGTALGCSPRVETKESLPGWPDVQPDPSTLDEANCF
ncbi:hypothetical protein [Actinokineospora sp.]|uniref:hypothetical protein n=1 Tax=Actinokineospora sp. TaxID=1872133 RepID=UPI0040384CDA